MCEWVFVAGTLVLSMFLRCPALLSLPKEVPQLPGEEANNSAITVSNNCL